jgi:hypothetical protein
MKAFLISMALIIAAGIFVITSYSSIGKWVITDVVQQEGSIDDMKAQVDKDPGAFTTKYDPFLSKRYMVLRAAEILDMAYFMDLSKDTLDRYLDTPLQTDSAIEYVMVKRGLELDSEVATQDAWNLYKTYMTLFPNGKDAPTVRNAMTHLSLKYGYQ